MRAYVLSIGSELILGHLTDTNATFLAQELAALGIELLHVVQVGDDRARIAETIRRAATDAEIVICSGGIGPTGDDLTRESIADVVGETPSVDTDLLATIEQMFAARGQVMPERNRKQAWLIPSAESLPNPVGTAPGWFVPYQAAVIAAMPGVPREMTRMWSEQVVPRLRTRLPNRVIRTTTYKTIGIGESAAEHVLDELVRLDNPVVATYAKDDGVHVRVTGIASTADEAAQLRDSAASEVVRRLGEHIYGTDDVLLSSALLMLAADRDARIAVIDEGGGGRFTSLLADSPFAEQWLSSGLARARGETTAAELAQEAAHTADIGIGIAVTTVPVANGLREGSFDIALAGKAHALEHFQIRAALPEIHRRSALSAADVMRRTLASPEVGVPPSESEPASINSLRS